MFSKKVEEHDEKKQKCVLLEKDINTASIEIDANKDYKQKYDRQSQELNELRKQYATLNEDYANLGDEYKNEVEQLNEDKAKMSAQLAALRV